MSDSNNNDNKNPQSIGDFLFFAKNQLTQFDHPLLEAEMLMSFVTENPRSWIKIHDTDKLSTEQGELFMQSVAKRTENIPLAYIMEYKIWSELKIHVSPAVLIPRDETELLAQYILESSQKNKSGLNVSKDQSSPDLNFSRDFDVTSVLDIGTGSGCLAIFCGKIFPSATITAVDICPEALKVGKKNAKEHDIAIEFIESDLLTKIPQKKYDIVIANLPYVPTTIEITEDVKKEPYDAIFSGKDGLDLIRKLAEQLKSREILFHELWLEFWTAQESEITQIFTEYDVEFYPDLSGDTYFAKITPQTNS